MLYISFKSSGYKLTCSTKKVDAIKDQNKALKVEVSHMEHQIEGLKKDLDNAHKRLVSVRKELEGTNTPLKRLKYLENENRALQEYIKVNEGLEKALKPFQNQKEQSYYLGQCLCDLKLQYADLKEKRKQKRADRTYRQTGKGYRADSKRL